MGDHLNRTSERYTVIAVLLHWIIAILILGQIAGGALMVNLGDNALSLKFQIYQWHKSFGITILVLSLIRLMWRLTHRPPALPDGMSSVERIGARFSHIGFYVLMVTIPLIGWATVSASPYAASVPTYLFGVIPWPHLPFFEGVVDREFVAGRIAEIHKILAFLTLGLFILHVGAALKHHFVNKDGVLARMLPFIDRGRSQ